MQWPGKKEAAAPGGGKDAAAWTGQANVRLAGSMPALMGTMGIFIVVAIMVLS